MTPQAVTMLAIGVVLGLQGACIELQDFPSAQDVTQPRILAVQVDPPEVNFVSAAAGAGQEVSLAVMVSEPRGVEDVRWRLCPAFYTTTGEQYDEGLVSGACGAEGWPLLQGNGRLSFSVASASIATLLGVDSLAPLTEVVAGVSFPPELVERVLEEVGFPFLVEVTVLHRGVELRAIKRLLISRQVPGNRNPPGPRIWFGDSEVVHRDGFECEVAEGGPLRMEPGAAVGVTPRVEGEQEAWLEGPYNVLNMRGELERRAERATYTYYASGGGFQNRVRVAPTRANRYTAPTSGCHRIWIVVQDGHGGLSACGVNLQLGDEPPCVDDR